MPQSTKKLEEKVSALEARVTALEKNPPKKRQRELLINLNFLNGGAPETPEASKARIQRAIKENLG